MTSATTLNRRNQRICAHTMPAIGVLTYIGLFLLPGWLPPPSPALPADQVARMFANNTRLRIGLELLMLAAPLFLGVSCSLAAQMRRMEGRNHVLADFQLCISAIGIIAVELPAFFWLAISYRPNIDPAIISVFNDLSWFMIIGGVGTAIWTNVAVGLCVLGDESGLNIYPRWFGYWSFWLVLADLPGAFIPFCKTGPFTWTGILGFWVLVTGFFVWLMLAYVLTLRAINAEP
jgi:hypothetical protein